MSLASAQLLSTVQARAAHAPKGLAFPCCPGTNTKLRKKPPPLPPWMQWAAVSTRSLPTLLSTVPEHSPGPSGVSTNSLPVVAAGARPYAPDQTSPVESVGRVNAAVPGRAGGTRPAGVPAVPIRRAAAGAAAGGSEVAVAMRRGDQ